MKRLLILTGVAVLAIASCARDEIKTVNKGHAIDFKVVETKGDVKQYAYDMDHFYVTAFNLTTDGQTLTGVTPFFTDAYFGRLGDYFTSNPAYYWPADGSPLLFFAYTPGADNTGATVTINSEKQEISDFAPVADINQQVDLMTAVGYGNKDNEATGVDLNFNHRLARIQVQAYENNAEYNYSVAGVRLVNFASKGTLNITADTNEWTLKDEKTTYSMEYADNVINIYSGSQTLMYNSYSERDYNDALVLPQTLTAWNPETDPNNDAEGAYIAIKLQIKAAASGTQIFPAAAGEYGWAAVPVPDGLVLTAGNVYAFSLNLTTGAGYIDPEDKDPEDDTTETILGDDIMFTLKVNDVEEPSEGAIARRELEGHWLAKKALITFVKQEGYEGTEEYDSFTKETEEELKVWFGNNGFYEFDVDNNYNLTIITSNGTVIPTSFTVDDDRNIYLEALKDKDTGEYPKIKIHDINQEEKTCVTLVIDENYYSGFDRYVYYTYDRK